MSDNPNERGYMEGNKVKITIAIPAHNAEKTLAFSILSAKAQEYPHKEILVLDDGSTDRTKAIAEAHKVSVISNETNKGIGYSLLRLMNEAKGKYIVYLCADDLFTDNLVVNDIVSQFDLGDPAVGIIGRYYYEFSETPDNVVGLFRDQNILTSSVNPSGMAFRRIDGLKHTNAVFVEMPFLVRQYLGHWRWTMFQYDTIAVRIHPGGNTGTKKEYYKGSAIENWHDIIGITVPYYLQFIQLRNRSTYRMLIREIRSTIRIHPKCLKDVRFWFCVLTALIVPGFLLRPLSAMYREKNHYTKDDVIRREP